MCVFVSRMKASCQRINAVMLGKCCSCGIGSKERSVWAISKTGDHKHNFLEEIEFIDLALLLKVGLLCFVLHYMFYNQVPYTMYITL